MTPDSTTALASADVSTPVGGLRVAAAGGRVVALAFLDGWEAVAAQLTQRFGRVPVAELAENAPPVQALRRYLDGELSALDDLDVDPTGTAFQERVWRALRRIPVGQTWSYAQLAAAVGQPSAVRAVGSANGANPVSIVVPCHRVIRSDGSLGGYGGGSERKAWLLAHEGARLT